jgi:hypothetical protein
MRTQVQILTRRQPSGGAKGHALSVVVSCLLLTATASVLAAQQGSSNRLIHVVVTDPANRFVTGLQPENFEVLENGVPRPIADFSPADTPVSIVIAGEPVSAEVAGIQRPGDEVAQASSLPDAVRRLMASKNARKVLITVAGLEGASGAPAYAIPGGIWAFRANKEDIFKTIVETRNQYSLGIVSTDPSASVNVALRQPRGLPPLKLTVKGPGAGH